MSFELLLFIIVAAVAIFSAALMLVSRNAVHSALFLVTNFLCVAFFYLMLSAPFLAMIQVTVYAGAIMVLFMFVIMLLGAEKLGGAPVKYGWMIPGAVVLASLFLIIAFVAIEQTNVGLLKPVPIAPRVQFVHEAAGAPAVDVYLNNDKVASALAYNAPTGLLNTHAGDANLLVFPTCTDPDPKKCADPIATGAAPILAQPVKLESDTATTFVVAGTKDQLQVITVPMDLSTPEDETTTRLVAVNALPDSQPANFLQLDPSDAANPTVLAPAVAFGSVSKPITLDKNSYNLSWARANATVATTRGAILRGKTFVIMLLAPELVPAQPGGSASTRPVLVRLDPDVRVDEAYGSPQQIGVSLLTTFLLPFELVSLLLLAAMVGAIILTREEVVKRERKRLVVSPAIRRLNKSLTTPSTNAAPANLSTIETSSAESSAD